jgi:hypothetical protein
MLVTAASMSEYFRAALTSARNKTGVALSEHAEAYLVRLLDEFARAENVYAGTERGERPAMATLLSRAQEAAPGEAVRIYKHMGDSSLYLTGFFAESVEREIVSVDYYVQMGGGAYANVAGLMRSTAATSSALFAELSDRFEELVTLLAEVSLLGHEPDPQHPNVVELLDAYRRTGRAELLEKLEQAGVVLRPGVKDDNDLIH